MNLIGIGIEKIDTKTSEGRIEQGEKYEKILDDILIEYKTNFKRISETKKYSWYDFIKYDKITKLPPILIELKSKNINDTSNINNKNINFISSHKINKFIAFKSKYKDARLIFVFCTIYNFEKYEYTIYEVDLELFENGTFFTTTIKNGGKLFEVRIRFFKSLLENIDNLI